MALERRDQRPELGLRVVEDRYDRDAQGRRGADRRMPLPIRTSPAPSMAISPGSPPVRGSSPLDAAALGVEAAGRVRRDDGDVPEPLPELGALEPLPPPDPPELPEPL